jgi:hypothetical protein
LENNVSNTPTRPNGQALNFLSGNALRRYLHGKTAGERARIAARLIDNKVAFADLSPAQVARLVEAHPGSVSVALGHAGTRGPHQRTLDRIVKRYGADTLLRALDRCTAPQPLVAAE